jgi:hypothetical protein
MANEAQVSPITASIALGAIYSFQAATCITDSTGAARYRATSRACLIRREHEWWSDPVSVQEIGGQVTRMGFGEFTLHAVAFGPPDDAALQEPTRDWRTILKDIAASVPAADRVRVLRQVYGVVGAANNYEEGRYSARALLRVFKQRFLGNQDLAVITGHPLFPDFLEAKAHELHARRMATFSDTSSDRDD